ncbi:TPA: hypothetical protein QH957_004609 [Enterobacter bugandensis]|nr:hypothetical protein [Enterobacter bugandensis]
MIGKQLFTFGNIERIKNAKSIEEILKIFRVHSYLLITKKNQFPFLTDDEFYSLHLYTKPGCLVNDINPFLRKGNIPEGGLKLTVNGINSALKKLNEQDNRQLKMSFRGTNQYEMFPDRKRGTSVIEPGFFSTSLDADEARKFFFDKNNLQLLIVFGRSGVNVEAIAGASFEKEVLYPSNTSFSLLTSSHEISLPNIKPRKLIFDLLQETIERRKNIVTEDTIFAQLAKEILASNPYAAQLSPVTLTFYVICESSILSDPTGYLPYSGLQALDLATFWPNSGLHEISDSTNTSETQNGAAEKRDLGWLDLACNKNNRQKMLR